MAGTSAGGGPGEIMLFGVRVVVDSMRKSVSLNNLSQYEQPQGAEKNSGSDDKNKEVEKDVKEDVAVAVAAGYGSADDAVHHSSGSRSERKRGVPWTEEEHKLFLIGLQKVGKGDWRGISRNFVKTRTPTQVASHAQKYFLRRLNINRRRRRSSLFDITTDTVAGVSMGDELQEKRAPTTTTTTTTTLDNLSLGVQGNHQCVPRAANLIRSPTAVDVPVPSLTRTSSRTVSDVDLNLNSSPAAADPLPLSLNLSLHSNEMESTRHSGFQMMCSLSGDSSISVA